MTNNPELFEIISNTFDTNLVNLKDSKINT